MSLLSSYPCLGCASTSDRISSSALPFLSSRSRIGDFIYCIATYWLRVYDEVKLEKVDRGLTSAPAGPSCSLNSQQLQTAACDCRLPMTDLEWSMCSSL